MFRVCSQYFANPSVILSDTFQVISSGKTQVHSGIDSVADTTGPCGKQMFHHTGLFQLREYQIL
jgi:hypothetical protein